MTTKIKTGLGLGILLLLVAAPAYPARAANLSWTANHTVDFSSPNVSATIASGSGATSLVVNAGSVAVVIANGDTFTLTSTETEFTVSGNTTAVVSNACASGTATAAITGGVGGETITIAPTGTACPGSSSGGSVHRSSSGGSIAPAPTPVPTTPPIGCLPGYLFNPTTGAPCPILVVPVIPVTPGAPIPSIPTTPSGPQAYTFGTGVVKLGTKGEGCKAWQKFLNDKHNAKLVVDGWCGKLTIAAAKSWQASVGLVADGLLGPMSRAKALAQAAQ